MPALRLYASDRFFPPLPAGHRFPAAKYRLLRERVAAAADPRFEVVEAPATLPATLARAHAVEYVERVFAGRLSPAEQRVLGLPYSIALVERARRSSGATLAGARHALANGVAVNLAGGTHHAGPARPGAFCLFNDVVVAARALMDSGDIERVLVLDLDVHQGDGTAEMTRDDPRIFTCSLHGARNYPARKVAGDLDRALPDGCDDVAYLTALDAVLPEALAASRPELVFYLAGADPFGGDRYGRLGLTKAGLAARDDAVFKVLADRSVPVVVCMAGGYAPVLADIVDIHCRTLYEALACTAPAAA